MPLHLLKMCVGCDSVEDLDAWQAARVERGEKLVHRTRNRPRRAAEVLDTGSLYWIIRGRIRVRQPILTIETDVNGDAAKSCLIGLGRPLVHTAAIAARPMQGWRYLEAANAPPDSDATAGDDIPAELMNELKQLGLA